MRQRGLDRLPHPAWRPVADPVDPRQRHGALRDRRRRQLPRLRRRRRRPRHGARHHRQRQDPAAVGVQRGRDPARARSRWPTRSCPAPPRRSPASSCSATTAPARSWPPPARPTEEDWATEFLDLRLAVRVVDALDDAIDHIARYGSGHTEAIVTRSLAAADRFTTEVDAAAVLVNASTRFVDGEEFGFGAEIGISHPEAPRPRPDGPARADHRQVRRRAATARSAALIDRATRRVTGSVADSTGRSR